VITTLGLSAIPAPPLSSSAPPLYIQICGIPRPADRTPGVGPPSPCTPCSKTATGFRILGGGLRSWLGVRCTCTPALNLTAPLLLRLLHRQPGTRGRPPGFRSGRGRAPRGSMRPVRRGARPRRTLGGTVREGNEDGGDAAVLGCRDLTEWSPGGRLFVAEGLDGVEARGLAGGIETEEDPDGGGEGERDENGSG
jgi:hypothetical protein